MLNQRVEGGAWGFGSRNLTGEIQNNWDYFETTKDVDLTCLAQRNVVQQVTILYLECKVAHHLRRRDKTTRNLLDNLTRAERFQRSLVKAKLDKLVDTVPMATIADTFSLVLEQQEAAGNRVFGAEDGAALWSAYADNLKAAVDGTWDFFLPHHLLDLRMFVGPFTYPGEGLLEGREAILAAFKRGMVYLRALWEFNNGGVAATC